LTNAKEGLQKLPKKRKRKGEQMLPTPSPKEKGQRMTTSTREAPNVTAIAMDIAASHARENHIHIAVSKRTGRGIEQIPTQQSVVTTRIRDQKNPTLHPEWNASKRFSRRALKEARKTAMTAAIAID
jgi:hypothetical protein